jgi:hypothetical protein
MQQGIDLVNKELTQLHSQEVLMPVDAASLTKEERFHTLCAINLIREKRTGLLKGRTCADGSSQRSLYPKEDTSSPTLSSDALMLSLLVDAQERRDVATAYAVEAYLNASMTDFVMLKITGQAVNILCTVNNLY